MAEVSLREINKTYNKTFQAVKNFNMEIKDREFIVLVGPSGCGKSTTLRMIAGLETVTSGEILINGKIVNEIHPKDRNIAMVFQNYALYPHMTVFDNISFGLKIRKFKKKEIENKVAETAKILNIESLLKRKPGQLSGGQRQRVALGRALVRDPELFLLDEPLSNLDAKLRGHMRTELTKLHQKFGHTMIYVTHDQMEAMTMGDRIVVMNNGNIEQIDTPMNLYDEPCNRFVAGFIGSPAMNFIEGRLIHENSLSFTDNEKNFKIDFKNTPLAVKLAKFSGHSVTMGIRPENISLVKDNFPSTVTAKGILELDEPLGNETFLHFKIGKNPILSRETRRMDFQTGKEYPLHLDMEKLLFFDDKSGERIN